MTKLPLSITKSKKCPKMCHGAQNDMKFSNMLHSNNTKLCYLIHYYALVTFCACNLAKTANFCHQRAKVSKYEK